jgi:hypothetical protein
MSIAHNSTLQGFSKVTGVDVHVKYSANFNVFVGDSVKRFITLEDKVMINQRFRERSVMEYDCHLEDRANTLHLGR